MVRCARLRMPPAMARGGEQRRGRAGRQRNGERRMDERVAATKRDDARRDGEQHVGERVVIHVLSRPQRAERAQVGDARHAEKGRGRERRVNAQRTGERDGADAARRGDESERRAAPVRSRAARAARNRICPTTAPTRRRSRPREARRAARRAGGPFPRRDGRRAAARASSTSPRVKRASGDLRTEQEPRRRGRRQGARRRTARAAASGIRDRVPPVPQHAR